MKVRFKSTTLDEFIERYSVDISRGGMFIRTRDPLAVGTVIRFEFTLDDSSPVLAGDATVVWRREHDPQRPGAPAGMGVKFDALTAESRQVLERILEAKNRVETGQAQAIGSSQPIPVPKGVHMDEDDELLRQPTKVAPLDELMGGDAADDALEPHERTVVAPATMSAELVRRSTTLDGISPPPMPTHRASSSVIPRAASAPPIPLDVAPTGSDDAPTGSLVLPTPSPDFSPPTPTPLPTTAYHPPTPPPYVPPPAYAPPAYASPSSTMAPPAYAPHAPPMGQSSPGVTSMPPAFVPAGSSADLGAPDLARQLAHAATYGASPLAQGTGPGALMGRVSGMTPAIQPQKKIVWVLGLVGGAALIAGGIALVVHGGRGDPKRTIAVASTPTEEDSTTAPVEQPVRPTPRSGPVDLEVITHPEGAQLHIDGQPFDQPTPTILRGLDARKTVKLVAVHECYEPAALEVTPDPTRPVEIVLKPREYALTITSSPPGATVKIDGREIGPTPKVVVLGKTDLDHALLVTLTRAGFPEKVVSFDPRQTCDTGKGVLNVALKR